MKISDFFGNFSGQKTEEVEDLEKVQMELLEKINLIGGEIKIIEREESETVFGLEEFNKNFQKAFEAIENKKMK